MSVARDENAAGRVTNVPAPGSNEEAILTPAGEPVGDFYRFASRSNDISVMLLFSVTYAYLLSIAPSLGQAAMLAVGHVAANIVVSIKVRRARRPVGLYVGAARLGLALIFVPPITYSMGGVHMGWLLGLPLCLLVPAYFPPVLRVLAVLALMAATLIPHHLNLPPGTWDLPAFVVLGVTGLFSVPLWGRLESNFHAIVRLGLESGLPESKQRELLRHQRRLLQGLVVSGTMFVAGVIITLVVYERVLTASEPGWAGNWPGHNMLVARLWLLLGAVTSLAFASLVYVVFGDRAHMEVMVQRRTAELASANHQIEAASRAKSLFLANMSHELRTPMTGVIGATDVLLANQPDPAKREFLDIIKASGQAMIAIIDDILDLSRIESGKLQLEMVAFDLPACLQSAVQAMQIQAAGKNVRLSLQCQPSLPRYIRTDQVRLRQILTNLLGNAIKFSENGRVEVFARAEGDTLHVEVCDTGIGISMENSSRLFRAFEQEDASTTRRYGGTGLGLAICSQLCQLLGGDIDVESAVGEGSVFSFHIEFTPARAEDVVAEQEAPRAANEHRLGVGLLVEDNAISQKVAKRLLETHFEQILVAGTGTQALALALEHTPDMIFMDVQMPEMDGLEATRRIREQSGRYVPIIALTANAFPEDRERCLESGMDDFLSKPMSAAELADVIARNVGLDAAATQQRMRA